MSGPLIVVVGETASGKSALAMELAQKYNGELICADSWTVRRGCDIGTAKPSIQEQQAIKHHLLDIVDPDEDFSAAAFKQLALRAIDDIQARGKLPILVGGTGLYVDGVIFDYNFLPVGQPGQREELERLSIDELLAQIEAEGLELGDVDVRNKRRLIRLIETQGAEQTKAELRANTLAFGLEPDRDELKERMARRVDEMIAAGLEQETDALQRRYGWNCEVLKGIGYREWREYFEGIQDLQKVRDRIISSTVKLARRQRAWFGRNKSIHWLSTPVDFAQVEKLTTDFLNN